MRGLRLLMWSAATLTIISQIAFLIELHSPQAMDEMLWSLFLVSVVCLIVFLYARSAVSSLKKWRS
jgi:nitric oxide reductase large subunit